MRWNPTYTEVVPNVAEILRGQRGRDRVFTFNLRDGMKWSDGKPFTADDILFNVNDLVLNADYAPTPTRYMAGGEPMKVEKVDDYTVKFTFAEPYGDFLAELASPLGQHPVLYAKHYCQQFHPTYAEEIDETVMADNAAGDWRNLFQQKCGDIEIPSRWGNAERPTLDPWVAIEPYTGGATRVVMERNPYFWQVDAEGNQLPYIDRSVAPIAQDVESLILQVDRRRHRLRPAPPRRAGEPAGAGREPREGRLRASSRRPRSAASNMVINLNLTSKNKALRELFNKKDFRVALSLGIEPARDHRHGAASARASRGSRVRSPTIRTTTSGSRPSTSSTTPPRPTRCSTSSGSTSAAPTACG